MVTTPPPRMRLGEMRWGRAILAASATGWTIVVLTLLATIFLFTDRPDPDPYAAGQFLNLLILFVIFGIPLALLAGFVVGLPALFLASRFWLSKWWQAPLIGGTAGGVTIVIWLAATRFDGPWLPALLTCVLAGALSALAAWLALGLNRKTT